MKLIKRKRDPIDVNLTPLIDVVFLLLIFFMVSTTFTKESRLTLQLPEAEGEAVAEQKDIIEVVVSAEGHYVINGRPLVNDSIKTLMSAIAEVSSSDSQLPFIITADQDAKHQAVIRVYDAAGRLGFTQIGITTKQTAE
ncbi:MAG TPA: biopolymer transporter ExbD [Gammaproteobacteria bacterium]|nr:biopolymer transporter ExbD [Gammaproteobacteria bacterium]MEC8009376.1 biopolymer transporter ExbD [Pseudomonadota bacterium]HBF09979.1 biopolymer transporter ExbD [Gammaproteobacteria bacterium]HCK93592.1 biopolymer transporter ExbD [Gammaproteobacteria bacterium]|tara:strand:+ start:2190 stop:2606 length:417 start_codon:yes stop_codon:yes gene_type:complete